MSLPRLTPAQVGALRYHLLGGDLGDRPRSSTIDSLVRAGVMARRDGGVLIPTTTADAIAVPGGILSLTAEEAERARASVARYRQVADAAARAALVERRCCEAVAHLHRSAAGVLDRHRGGDSVVLAIRRALVAVDGQLEQARREFASRKATRATLAEALAECERIEAEVPLA